MSAVSLNTMKDDDLCVVFSVCVLISLPCVCSFLCGVCGKSDERELDGWVSSRGSSLIITDPFDNY